MRSGGSEAFCGDRSRRIGVRFVEPGLTSKAITMPAVLVVESSTA
jgi:hypothetical protein